MCYFHSNIYDFSRSYHCYHRFTFHHQSASWSLISKLDNEFLSLNNCHHYSYLWKTSRHLGKKIIISIWHCTIYPWIFTERSSSQYFLSNYRTLSPRNWCWFCNSTYIHYYRGSLFVQGTCKSHGIH